MNKSFAKSRVILAAALCVLLIFCASAGLAEGQEEILKGLYLKTVTDFEGAEQGDTIDFSEDTADWYLHGASVAFVMQGASGGKYVQLPDPAGGHHEFQMQYANDLSNKEYALTVDAKMIGGQVGLYVKGCEPIYRVNPAYKDSEMLFCSSTYYVQNGGKSVSWNGMGGSGFCVTASDANTLRIDVAVFEEDGIFVSHRNCRIPVNADVKNTMNTYTFQDDNNGTVSCYINGELFASVEYSDTTTYPLDTDDIEQYEFYKNVTVKDASGSVLLTVENSRLSSRNVLAIAERGSAFEFDNVAVYTDEEPEPTPEITPSPEITPTPGPEQSGEPEQSEQPEQSASAEAPVPTQEITPSASDAGQDNEGGLDTLTIVLIAAAAVVIAGGIAAFFIIKSKKKSAK